MDKAARLMDACYQDKYDSEEDFAISFAEDTMTIPAYLAYYIEYEKMVRDLFINDYVSINVYHVMHVFIQPTTIL